MGCNQSTALILQLERNSDISLQIKSANSTLITNIGEWNLTDLNTN